MASWDQAHGGRSSNVPLNANGYPAFPAQQFDPRALLNPRGYHRETQDTSRQNNFSRSRHIQPQLSFQFDTASITPQHVSCTQPQSQHLEFGQSRDSTSVRANGKEAVAQTSGHGAVTDLGHMLERVHNVQNRDAVPVKRRKLVDERDVAMKSNFSGGVRGGVLGQYVKEQREEGRRLAAASNTAPPVEISLDDDDDDVRMIVDSGDKEVCYGRIEGAEINAHKVPTPKSGATAITPGFWPQVKIVLRRRVGERGTIINAIDSTREIIGCVDVNTAIGLTPLLDSNFGLRTVSRILTRQRRDGDPNPGTEGVSLRYLVDLNLYGPKKYSLQIGRHLSQKNLWLRTPLFVENGVELYNPHAIERPPQPPPRSANSYGYRQQGPARTTEEIRNDVLGMFDSLERSDDLPEMNPDHRVTTALLRHQKQGLHFMTDKEKLHESGSDQSFNNTSLWKPRISANGQRTYLNIITGQEERQLPPQVLGGILADMMGLGKTLSILSLIMHTLDNAASEWAELRPQKIQEDRDLHPVRKGKAKVPLPKIEQTSLVQNVKTTLLVSPLSTIANWEDQIKQHIEPGTLRYHIYHGPNRIKDIKKLADYDVVITTYGSVASEFNHRSKRKQGLYPLEEINWFRIVLDEAHMIREQSTQQSKAICRLAASRRWAVTGTPVQNRLEDLGALMTFLRIKPFDERGGFAQYIMSPFKLCDPEILPKLRLLVDSITLRRLKDRIDLPSRHDHLVKLDFSPEERAIYDIFAKNASDRVKVIVGQRENHLSGRSYVHILQSILRLRLICAHGRDLLGEEDLKVMNGLSKDSAIDLDSDDEDDQPGLSAKQAYDMYNLMKETNADMCLTCGRKIGLNDPVDVDGEVRDEIIGFMTPCYHVICSMCIDRYKSDLEEVAQGQPQTNCPICQQYIKLSYFPLRQGGVDDEDESRHKSANKQKHSKDICNYSGPHTKTKALIQDLLASKQQSQVLPPEAPIKSVVFSGWTAHLDLIQFALDEHAIKFVRLDGKMSRTSRGVALENFRNDPTVLVILVSITAGGLGLNLTTASKVYVMEPQYNPAAEAQAVDRVHRLGQKREVETVRYIMNDSFEEKMLALQDKKKKLASLSMDREGKGRIDKDEAARKRLEDLRSLFK